MSNSVYLKLRLCRNFSEFKFSAFQLNLLLLSQISTGISKLFFSLQYTNTYKWWSIYCKWQTTIVCIHFRQTYLIELPILLNPSLSLSRISDNSKFCNSPANLEITRFNCSYIGETRNEWMPSIYNCLHSSIQHSYCYCLQFYIVFLYEYLFLLYIILCKWSMQFKWRTIFLCKLRYEHIKI
jgi:hypothetical protein